MQNCSIDPTALKEYGDKLNIIYTPIHGTGYRLVPEILKRSGVTNLIVVKEQEVPDGNFPTVHTPNPEHKECFNIAIEKVKAENIDCHLIIGTDPDADRVGIVAKDDKGEFVPFTGNQVGALLADYIINSKKAQGNLPANACAIKSVVSGKLFDLVCEGEGVHHMNVLTGFKYIGEKIKEFTASGEYTFILGYEESYGYLSGGYVRDKDAVAASMLIAEMAAYNMRNGGIQYAQRHYLVPPSAGALRKIRLLQGSHYQPRYRRYSSYGHYERENGVPPRLPSRKYRKQQGYEGHRFYVRRNGTSQGEYAFIPA